MSVIDITKLIDKDIEINRKYHEIVASRIKDREKQILRQLTYEEQEEIYNKTAKELGWK